MQDEIKTLTITLPTAAVDALEDLGSNARPIYEAALLNVLATHPEGSLAGLDPGRERGRIALGLMSGSLSYEIRWHVDYELRSADLREASEDAERDRVAHDYIQEQIGYTTKPILVRIFNALGQGSIAGLTQVKVSDLHNWAIIILTSLGEHERHRFFEAARKVQKAAGAGFAGNLDKAQAKLAARRRLDPPPDEE